MPLADELMRDYPPDPQSPVGVPAVLRTGKPAIVPVITDEMLVQGAVDARHLELLRTLGPKSYICVPLVVSGKAMGALTFLTAGSGLTYTQDDVTLATELAHRAAIAVENTQLYQALREADRRKDEFLATLAHELRNPLAPIRNALEILRLPRAAPDTLERARSMMERQVQQVVRLVDDLLDVSRVMGGKIELRRESIELAAVLARAVETAQPLIDGQQHTLTIDVPPSSMPLSADGVRLSQVVSNLLTNAAKYTDPGGHITLSAGRDGDMAFIRVEDNGIGLDPSMRHRIFDLFVQADHAATRAQGGLGVGLTLARTLVDMHDGTIEADSRGLGQGSVFTVKLPLLAGSPPEDEPQDTVGESDTTGRRGLRVLVVDDNHDAAESFAIVLKGKGHDVSVAFDGREALELAASVAPEIVFLDIGMPGMDGHDVARLLRQTPLGQQTVLVALTGWGQEADRRRSQASGFDHHEVKPLEPERLARLLHMASLRAEGEQRI
jgi:signal transduction histidine kinase/ActR/RegA family two-component response regulator